MYRPSWFKNGRRLSRIPITAKNLREGFAKIDLIQHYHVKLSWNTKHTYEVTMKIDSSNILIEFETDWNSFS